MQSITLKLDLYEYKQVEATSKLMAEKLGISRETAEADLTRLASLLSITETKPNTKKGEVSKARKYRYHQRQ
ncbi:MAG: hypothetical protein IPO37_19000 [Saprospiraceae bacterium]|nr:hypothetical protein [Saprospiraceae bacterium]